MRVAILGSAAGGGFPQWNCGCRLCAGVRTGTIRARPRTQTQVAVSGDGERWFLLGASPDLRAQIEAFPPLQPRAVRSSPIAGVVLANGDLDHVLGLFLLREEQPLAIWSTEAVRRGLVDENVLARTLDRFPGHSTWASLALEEERVLDDRLAVTAVAVPGKVPRHLEGRAAPSPEDGVALFVRDRQTGGILAFAPGVGQWTAALEGRLREAHAVLFDGTFWTGDELAAQGLGTRTAGEMAHLPLVVSLPHLLRLPGRTLLVHVNNTNPILDEASRERAALGSVEVAEDGVELVL